MSDAEVLGAKLGDVVQLRVRGRATNKISTDTKEFCQRSISNGARRVIVDFSECQAMDSTFMGVLAKVSLDGEEEGCEVVFVNISAHLRELLEQLGIDGMFRFSKEAVADVDFASLCDAAKPTDADTFGRTVLEAHETLIQLDPRNLPKFKSVVDMLAAELGTAKKKEGDSP